MPPPPVTIYVTSLTSQPKVRKHIDLLHRALNALEIEYEAFDLATDEDAKRRWQRAKPVDKVVGLPGYLVGGEWIGTMDDFEDAVETGTLETFLKQDIEHADASQTIGEAELDRLMREMTDADLDQLVGDLSVDASAAADISTAGETSTKSPAKELAQPKAAAGGILASLESAAGAVASSVKATVGDVASAAGAFADDATGQAAVEGKTEPKTTPEPGSVRAKVGDKVADVASAAGAFADEATGQAAVEAPTPVLTPAPSAAKAASTSKSEPEAKAVGGEKEKKEGTLAGIASAAAAFADEATGEAALEAPTEPKVDDGPKPGEKTLDEVIDETMEKEKEEYDKKEIEKDNAVEEALIRKDE